MFLPDFLKKPPAPRVSKRSAAKRQSAVSKPVVKAPLRLPDGVQERYSARAKRLALRLDTKARIFHLVIPKRTSAMRAESFAWEHEAWIKQRLNELPTAITFQDGVTFSLMGRDVKISVNYSTEHKRTDIHLEADTLFVRTNKDDPHGRIVRFLKNMAKEELSLIAQEKAAELKKNIQSISIRDTKSRWGSCSYDGKISFSWRLILAPYDAIDYVVAHEVAHLKHLDHSQKFWTTCETLSQNYKTGKDWMRQNAHELMRYQ